MKKSRKKYDEAFKRKAVELSHDTYGSPRIKVEMDLLGYTASRQLLARLMRAKGKRARRRKRFVSTTDSKHNYPIAPNILNRHFDVDRSNKVWVSDITYVHTLKAES